MKQIKEGKVLIVADSHQRMSYVDAVINKEGDFDHCVLLGDEFDNFYPPDGQLIYNMKETCNWINSKLGDNRFIWLLANHTLAYLASYTPKLIPPKSSFYSCSGWTRDKAKDFNRYINTEWFKKLELCCKVGDFYCVHGGFSYRQFKPFMSEAENIQNLYDEWEKDKLTFHHKPFHWINFVGPSRYGMDEYSSPIWLDFYDEFVPLDETQIICGHTNSRNNPYCKKNANGLENWCIDNEQSAYAVWQDGKLEIKRITEKDYREFLTIET